MGMRGRHLVGLIQKRGILGKDCVMRKDLVVRLCFLNHLSLFCVSNMLICCGGVVPAGNLLTVKGEASDEDEETEYFDAMEDAPSFITVAADPTKHHR